MADMSSVAVAIALITILAGHHGVDPAYMLCLAEHESDYRQEAIGQAGEIGVFQILPSTGAWFASKSGLSGDLTDLMANINLTAWAVSQGYGWMWSTNRLCQ